MFTQTRTNLKFIGVILFTITFLVGVFFIKTTNAEAVSATQSFNVSYSLSPVTSTPNNDGGITTTVLIGCAPGSGDIYDINTGKPCISIARKVLVGCAVGSGDLYDINTGKKCTNKTIPVLIGCAVGSGDIYDITTGQRCTVDTSITKPILKKNTATVTTVPVVNTPTITQKLASITSNITETSPEILPIDNTDNTLSGREKLGDSLSAGVTKAGSIFTGPMAIPLILLIIIILLGGGYAVYSLVWRKEDGNFKKVEVKKIPITPLTHSQVNTPNPAPITQTMPLNTPQSR